MALSNSIRRTLTIAWLLGGGLQGSACFSSSDAEPSAARQSGMPSRTTTSQDNPTPQDVELADASLRPQDVEKSTPDSAGAEAPSDENDSSALDADVDVDANVGLAGMTTACGTPDAGALVGPILNAAPASTLMLTAPPVELPPEIQRCELHTLQFGVGSCSSEVLCDRVAYGSNCNVLQDGTWNCSCTQYERPAPNRLQFSVAGGDSTLCAAAVVPCLPGRGPDEDAGTCEVSTDDSSHWTRDCTSQFDVANFTATVHRYRSVTCDGADCFCPDLVAAHYVFADACLADKFAITAEYCTVDREFPPPSEDDCGVDARYPPFADGSSCDATFVCENEVSWEQNAPALRVTNGYAYCDRGSKDEPWSCQCSFDNRPLEFDILPAKDPSVDAQTCMDAFGLCQVLEESHKDGDVTCKHAAWQFDAGFCTARADCVQPATALGRELVIKGSVGAECTEYEAGKWACNCRADQQQTKLDLYVEGQEAQACEQAIVECTKLVTPTPLPG